MRFDIENLTITDSKGIDLYMTIGEPITRLSITTFNNSIDLKTNVEPYQSENILIN